MRSILLVQLPIPPVGPEPIRGNVPLAAGYLKLFAQQRGLEAHYDIEILPTIEANTLGDQVARRCDFGARSVDGRLYVLSLEHPADAMDRHAH